MIIGGEFMLHRLTEQDYQIVKRPSGSAGRRTVAPECGSLHV